MRSIAAILSLVVVSMFGLGCVAQGEMTPAQYRQAQMQTAQDVFAVGVAVMAVAHREGDISPEDYETIYLPLMRRGEELLTRLETEPDLDIVMELRRELRGIAMELAMAGRLTDE